MIVEETLHTCTHYPATARSEDSEEHNAKTYHRLVLQGKLRKEVRWITERETRDMMQPEEHCKK